jgi:hypothetical protein
MARVAVWHEYKVNMGNYEHVVFGARVEVDTNGNGDIVKVALDDADQAVQEKLAPLLEEARDKTACEESYVHEWEIVDAEAVSPPSQQRRRG